MSIYIGTKHIWCKKKRVKFECKFEWADRVVWKSDGTSEYVWKRSLGHVEAAVKQAQCNVIKVSKEYVCSDRVKTKWKWRSRAETLCERRDECWSRSKCLKVVRTCEVYGEEVWGSPYFRRLDGGKCVGLLNTVVRGRGSCVM